MATTRQEDGDPVYSNEQETEKAKYFIDIKWYDEQNRSFRAVAQARFCRSCQAKLGSETQERVPTVDPKTGRVVFEMRTTPFGTNPMSVIRSCCSKAKGYITLETPVLEAIFRLFLANANQPADLETLREQLAEYIHLNGRPHGYAPEYLERLIQNDRYYGLRRFEIDKQTA
jgi:hypothetical protein